jgi:hypothetical protein
VGGLDLDAAGDVIPEVQERADAAGMPIEIAQVDLLDIGALHQLFGVRPPHVFLSMGLTVWLDPESRMRFIQGVHDVMSPAGIAIIDNFRRHESSRYLKEFEMEAWYPSDEEQESQLQRAGFTIESKIETSNGVNVVYVLRKSHRVG